MSAVGLLREFLARRPRGVLRELRSLTRDALDGRAGTLASNVAFADLLHEIATVAQMESTGEEWWKVFGVFWAGVVIAGGSAIGALLGVHDEPLAWAVTLSSLFGGAGVAGMIGWIVEEKAAWGTVRIATRALLAALLVPAHALPAERVRIAIDAGLDDEEPDPSVSNKRGRV